MEGYVVSWQSDTWCTERTSLCELFAEKKARFASHGEAAQQNHLSGFDIEKATLVDEDERAPAAHKSS